MKKYVWQIPTFLIAIALVDYFTGKSIKYIPGDWLLFIAGIVFGVKFVKDEVKEEQENKRGGG